MKIKRKIKSDIKIEGSGQWGDENVKGRRKVGESVNVKKMSAILFI